MDRTNEESFIWRPALWVGMLISLLLIVVSTVITTVESARAEERIPTLFYDAERTTFLTAQISIQLAVVEISLLEALTEEIPESLEDLHAVRAGITAYIEELPGLLSPAERLIWEDMRPRLVRLRDDFTLALEAIRRGDVVAAEATLDRARPRMGRVLDSFASLVRVHQAEMNEMLVEVERRLRLVRWMQALTGLALIGATILIWGGVMGQIRRQARQLRTYTAQIEQSNADLEAFAGRVAHDLRNVLAPLPMLAALLEGGEPRDLEVVAEQLERTAGNAVDFVDSLLSFSKSGGKPDPEAASSLREVIASCVEEQRRLAERVGAEVSVAVEDDPHVRVPKELAHAVIVNVLNNALKFVEGRSRRVVRVTAGVSPAEGPEPMAWIDIEDSGPGIPQAEQPRLFEVFYRGKNRSAPGSGIGLSTVQRIVHAYGGRVEIESTVGTGTRFRISLPLAARPDDGAPAAAPGTD